MSSEKHNGIHTEGNAACSSDSSEKKPQHLDPDELYEAYLSPKHKGVNKHDNVQDDIDWRFMEEVYKERKESSEGWDRYLEILRDGLNNDDEIASNLDPHQYNSKISSNNFNGAASNSVPKVSNSYPPNVTLSKEEEKHAKPKAEEQKDVHYFRNGTCFFGNPMKDAKRTEKQRKSKSTLDESEVEFYKNLRAYYGAAKEKTGNRTTQNREKKQPKLSTSPPEIGSKYFAADGTRKKSTNTTHTEQNGLSSKGAEKGEIGQTSHSGLDPSNFKYCSTSKIFPRKEATEQNEKKEDVSTMNTNTIETNKEKTSLKEKTKETKLRHTEGKAKFENGLKTNVHSSNEGFSRKGQREEDFKIKNDSTTYAPEQETYWKPLSKHDTASKIDNSVSSEMKKGHKANPSKQNFSVGTASGWESVPSTSQQDDYSPSQGDTACSSKKNFVHSMSSPSESSSNDQVDGKKSSSLPTNHASKHNTKQNFSHPTEEKQQCGHKGKTKCTKTSEESSFSDVGAKINSQRKSSFEKEESKSQRERANSQRKSSFDKDKPKSQTVNDKAYRKTKKPPKTPEDPPQHSNKPSSASRLQREGKLPRHKMPDSYRDNENPFQNTRFVRQSKEEMIRTISASEELDSLLKRLLYGAKDILMKCLKVFLWILYYAIIIVAVVVLCLIIILKGTIKYLLKFIMSLGITIAIIDKLSIVKVWYNDTKEFFKEKIYGPKRPAQTYNLPNSGEDAVQQLLLRQGPEDNPYRILGVPKEASDEDIRKQYRKFAVLVHPDKNKHPHSAKAFQILSSAYDILGDADKRQQYDRDLAIKEQMEKDRAKSGNFMKNPADYKDPNEFLADLMKQMEEIRESMACNSCGGRHRRHPTKRSVYLARSCSNCYPTMHYAKEGDFWKESTYLGLGPGKFYTRMEDVIYDITEWGICQQRSGFHLPSDSHKVCGKINSHRKPPPQSFNEEQFFRDLFGHHEDFGHGHQNHGHQNHHSHKNKQQKRRRKKK